MKTYLINSHHNIYKDSYKEGQSLTQINSFSICNTILKAKTVDEALKEYIEHHLSNKYNKEHIEQYEHNKEYQTSCLVDEYNNEILENEELYKDWKKDEKELFADNYGIEVFELKQV